MDAVDRTYPTALTAGPHHEHRGLRDALAWALTHRAPDTGRVLVYMPRRDTAEDNALLRSALASSAFDSATWTQPSRTWRGGPVVVAWPDREHLAEVADDHRVSALVVVPWVDDAIAAWATATQPELLGPAHLPALRGPALDPVVKQGLQALSVWVNPTLTTALIGRYRDHGAAVLSTLHAAGYRWHPDQVHAWALTHQWRPRAAHHLATLAADVASGTRSRRGGASSLPADAIAQWRRQASGV